MTDDARIEELTAGAIERHLPELAGLLQACVHAGASVGFVLPCPLAECRAVAQRAVTLTERRTGRGDRERRVMERQRVRSQRRGCHNFFRFSF